MMSRRVSPLFGSNHDLEVLKFHNHLPGPLFEFNVDKNKLFGIIMRETPNVNWLQYISRSMTHEWVQVSGLDDLCNFMYRVSKNDQHLNPGGALPFRR